MSTLLGWIARARALPSVTSALLGSRMPLSNLYLYDDCCVLAKGDVKFRFTASSQAKYLHEQAEEQAKLTIDELVGQSRYNWRVDCADIANAAFVERNDGAALVLNLVDGATKRLVMYRSRDDHRQKELCQRWLGEKLTLE